MIIKKLNKDYHSRSLLHKFDIILWLRKRILVLESGIKGKRRTDSTSDFELLSRKLKIYKEEYDLRVNEIHLLLKKDEKTLF